MGCFIFWPGRLARGVFLLVTLLLVSGCGYEVSSTGQLASVGEALYFDANLSSPPGQACASCHSPGAGFADPDRDLPVSEGVVTGRFGNRNSPTVSYAAFVPPFRFDPVLDRYLGGQFLDGRAATLEEQAKGPFLNVLEMNNPDKETVVERVRLSAYAGDFEAVFGPGALDDSDTAFEQIASAIAAFERTGTVSPFSSKFDAVEQGRASFTASEQRGRNLFFGRAGCARCHGTPPRAGAEVFSNFTYENIGVPANPENPFYFLEPALNPDGTGYIDLGLGGQLGAPGEWGKFRVPTLRNVALTAPYMHNGVFTTLEQVVTFYSTRDTDPGWPDPEVAVNVASRGIGNLGLTGQEISDLVAFLQTLSDGFIP